MISKFSFLSPMPTEVRSFLSGPASWVYYLCSHPGPRAQKASALCLMLCHCHLKNVFYPEILSNFWTRSLAFSSRTGPQNYVIGPASHVSFQKHFYAPTSTFAHCLTQWLCSPTPFLLPGPVGRLHISLSCNYVVTLTGFWPVEGGQSDIHQGSPTPGPRILLVGSMAC